ncbi:phosphatidylglycerophosphatase A [Aurantimonas sp. HBX-1]|uniref:phosphatidylglycerophosphatase A family protein n=1 Tax=Aurantimonas sp. HBX-1 TaxID=2906072 RepID=UPI001F228443|nr:phosphatidylglycerophosphatase A [Aurantimonas sp. HBX-1]UIJ72931.1 phosphatidylglycerophosphatase A [Aurantimonas sp. HBX-1]
MDTTLRLLDVPGGLSWTSPALWLSTWFGAGLVHPLRAGLAIATALFAAILLRRRTWLAALLIAVTGLGATGVVLWDDATGTGDDRRIVVDEVAGFLLVASVLGAARWQRLLLAAPIYLVIDRSKIWPLEWLEALPGAVGVMGDDMGAALITIPLFLAAEKFVFVGTARRARS